MALNLVLVKKTDKDNKQEEKRTLSLHENPPVDTDNGLSIPADEMYGRIILECNDDYNTNKELYTKLAGLLNDNNFVVSLAVNSEPDIINDDKLFISSEGKKDFYLQIKEQRNQNKNRQEFDVVAKNDSDRQFFGRLAGFSFVSITVGKKDNEGDSITLYSDFFKCWYPNDEKKNIEEIISEVANNYSESAVDNPESLDTAEKTSFSRAGHKPKTSKELDPFLELLDTITETYRKYLKYLKIKPAHKIEKESVPVPFYCVKNINISDTLKKDLRFFTENNSGVGPKYLPVFVHGEVKKKSLDTYENTTILQFLVTVADSVGSLKKNLEKQTEKTEDAEDGKFRFRLNDTDGKVCPVYAEIINPKLSYRLDKTSKELQILIKEYASLFHIYGKGKLEQMPRSTKVFQEVHPYNEFFEIMVHWFRDGTIFKNEFEKIRLLARTKSMDKLFEYYCLLKLKKMLEDQGYVSKETRSYSYLKNKVIAVKDGKGLVKNVEQADNNEKKVQYDYKEESEIYNTFEYKNENSGETAVLYYRPCIPSIDDTKESLNGVDLHRHEMGWKKEEKEDLKPERKYYEPDFVLKFSKRGKQDAYVIMDPKFSKRDNIERKYLVDIKKKYFQYLKKTEVKGQDNSSPVMVWALQGRSYKLDDSTLNTQDKYYDGRLLSSGIQPFTPKYFEVAVADNRISSPTKILWDEIKSCLERCWQESSANGQNGT